MQECESLQSVRRSITDMVVCLQVTSLMVSEDERAESTNVFTVLNSTDAEGNNSGKH